MFVICTPEQSEDMLQELIGLEKRLFTQLGLHFKVLLLKLLAKTLVSVWSPLSALRGAGASAAHPYEIVKSRHSGQLCQTLALHVI